MITTFFNVEHDLYDVMTIYYTYDVLTYDVYQSSTSHLRLSAYETLRCKTFVR
jgi:hypothetical protein